MKHKNELFLLIENFDPEYHSGFDNIVGAFNSVPDAELFLFEYAKDMCLDPKNFGIVSVFNLSEELKA